MWGSLQKYLASYSKEDRSLIKHAFELAQKCHQGQKRLSGEPYIAHPVAVATDIAKLNLDVNTIVAAILHDIIEDCKIDRDEFKNKFGRDVLFLVEGVTKISKIKYRGEQRNIESIRKMMLAVAEDIRVIIIKLFDRLHNIKTIRAQPKDKQLQKAQETIELFAPIADRLGMGELKGELEDLCFPVIYPDQYKQLTSNIKEHIEKRKKYLRTVEPILRAELAKNEITKLTIDYRAKHYFSLWKKAQKNGYDADQITDLIAMRIIADTVEECYRILGIIHALWKPLPGKIKDYIAMPKTNGYRSLHTTVFCIDNKITEFQIRTREMHEEAEFGVAAHWAYEESGKKKEGAKANTEKMEWISRLRKWQEEFGNTPSDEFIEALKIDFFKDRVFVLTPKGEIIDLPEGSTPVDFAYHIHTDIGNHMAGVRVNDKMVSFSYVLSSGDRVEILTQKNKSPKPDWLEYAKSNVAKGHIRSQLRKTGVRFTHPLKSKPHLQRREFEITLSVKDRVGLLKDITNAVSKMGLDIRNIDLENDKKPRPKIKLTLKPSKKTDAVLLTRALKKIRSITQVSIKQ